MKGFVDLLSKTASFCKLFQGANSFLYSKHHRNEGGYKIPIKKSFSTRIQFLVRTTGVPTMEQCLLCVCVVYYTQSST